MSVDTQSLLVSKTQQTQLPQSRDFVTPRSILILCDLRRNNANTIDDHIDAFTSHSRHRIFLFDPLLQKNSWTLNLDEFDVVVIHYSISVIHDHYLSPAFRTKMRNFTGLKVQFIQDEYRQVQKYIEVMRYMKINVLYTAYPEHQISSVYGEDQLPGVKKITTLTGYVPERLLKQKTLPIELRPIDVGYRGRNLPYWMGALSQEKIWIGERFLKHSSQYALRCDIAWKEEDRIYGDQWNHFMGSCKAVLGTESGASITDFDGSIEERCRTYLAAHPEAPFEEVFEEILKPYENNLGIRSISPRIFEAAALRTALILFPGEYSGLLQADRHYIHLEKDLSNIAEVAQKMKDIHYLRKLTDSAYQDLIASEKYSYRNFICDVDLQIQNDILKFQRSTPSMKATYWAACAERWCRHDWGVLIHKVRGAWGKIKIGAFFLRGLPRRVIRKIFGLKQKNANPTEAQK